MVSGIVKIIYKYKIIYLLCLFSKGLKINLLIANHFLDIIKCLRA
jgi:hypothetical protein